jgi:hypothetical protein
VRTWGGRGVSGVAVGGLVLVRGGQGVAVSEVRGGDAGCEEPIMTVRAKFKLTKVMTEKYAPSYPEQVTLVFEAQYDDTIEEDRRFAKATPTGRFEMRVDNPTALAFFELGKTYYFDVSEAV